MNGPRYPDGTAYIGGDQLDAAHIRFRLRETLPFTPPRIEATMVATDPYATATVSTMKMDKAIMLASAIEKLAGVLDEHLKLMEAMKLAAPRSVALQIEEKAKMLREMLE